MKWCRKKNKRESVVTSEQRSEKLVDIGNYLRLKRQEQSMSLEKVAAKTRIQQRLLQAIEAGNLDELPEPVYIQSFIKQYADALGLDGAELSSSFPASHSRLSLKPAWRSLSVAQLRPVHLYLLYIFLIVCAVNYLSQILSHSVQVSSHQEQPFVPSPPRQAPTSSEKVKPVNAATNTSKPVQISVTLKAESWIRVIADGKTQFQGVLPAGTQRTWVAEEQLTVRAGNAGGVLVTFNQQEAKQMGDVGQVQEVTFAANQRS